MKDQRESSWNHTVVPVGPQPWQRVMVCDQLESWLRTLRAEQEWKAGNRNPLEELLG